MTLISPTLDASAMLLGYVMFAAALIGCIGVCIGIGIDLYRKFRK